MEQDTNSLSASRRPAPKPIGIALIVIILVIGVVVGWPHMTGKGESGVKDSLATEPQQIIAPAASANPPVHFESDAATNVSEEQHWLATNLPDETTDHIVVEEDAFGSSITEKTHYQDRFSATAIDANTWRFDVWHSTSIDLFYASGTFEHRGPLEETSECTVPFKEVPWNSAMTSVINLRDDKHYVAGDQQISLPIFNDAIHCNFSYAGKTSHPSGFELRFSTEERADKARMALISHANPEAAVAIGREQDWIDSHITNAPVRFRVELDGPGGPIKMEDTEEFTAEPIDVGFLKFKRVNRKIRSENGVTSNSEILYTCEVEYKKVDWSKVTVAQYQPSTNMMTGRHALDKPAYYLSVSDDKSILCDDTWPDTKPPSQYEGSALFLIFETPEAAHGFADQMSEHAKTLSDAGRSQPL